jgi:hypothetical protein
VVFFLEVGLRLGREIGEGEEKWKEKVWDGIVMVVVVFVWRFGYRNLTLYQKHRR